MKLQDGDWSLYVTRVVGGFFGPAFQYVWSVSYKDDPVGSGKCGSHLGALEEASLTLEENRAAQERLQANYGGMV